MIKLMNMCTVQLRSGNQGFYKKLFLHTFEQDRPNKSRKEMRKSAMNRIRGGVQGIGQGKEKVLWKKKGLLEEGK